MTESLPEETAIPQFSLDAFSLAGRTAIVSGGSDGIGRMIAHGFADAGANVVIAARGVEKIENVVAEIENKGHAVLGVPTDVTDPDAVRALVERAIERFGRVDVLMNVVGGSQGPTFKRGPLLELTKHDFNEAFNINVTSAFLCSQAVVPHMLERGGGVIINMASVGARDYRLPETRHERLQHDQSVRDAPHAQHGEGVGAHHTGELHQRRTLHHARRARTEHPDRRARSLAEIEIGRFGRPEDIAGAAVFIASDAGAFFNGSYLDLHGGT